MHKHKKITVARAPLGTAWKQVSVEMDKVLYEPITASREAKQITCESNTVSTETKLVSWEATKARRESKIASTKAIWIKKNPT